MSGLNLPTDKFLYSYLAGPVDTAEEIEAGITEGNCRLALQLYFYRVHQLFLPTEEIYLPGGYQHLGEFICKEEPIDFSHLKTGDIIYAQNFQKKSGELFHRELSDYNGDYDKWVFDFHSAIFINTPAGNHIWHATSIANGPALWTLEEFEKYYKPISVKRINLPS